MDDTATLPDGWAAGEVESNGVRIHYTRTGGDGPVLVVAHGVFDDGRCRTPLVREFQDEYDVVAFDARGHGRSDAPESGYGVDERVADLVGLLDAIEIADPILFGHSMGGDTVLATAAQHPDLPRAVVAVDPASLLEHDEDEDEEGVENRAEGVRQQIRWWHDHSKAELLAEDDELAGHVEAGDEELASLLADARLRVSPNIVEVFENGWLDPEDAYPEITAETLVLRADSDESQRERDHERADKIENGRLVHIDGAGHCVFRDRREVATGEMRQFLDRI